MNLLDAIKLYAHMMQQNGGLAGREAASKELLHQGFDQTVINSISYCVSNDGILTAGKGGRFAITELSSS
jgi:hypothetical protein